MWKRVITKAPTATTASRSSGGVFGRREAILPPTSPTLFASLEYSRYSHQQYQSNIHARQVHRRYYNHHRHRHSRWPFIFDLGTVSTSSHNNLQQHQQFRTSLTIANTSERKERSTLPKKGQKRNNRHPRRATPTSQKQKHIRSQQPVHEMAAGMGITLEECSKDLIEACSNIRAIELNKRQRLKPWIMALLIHRYDRGIRDTDELNTDSVYYDGGRSTSNEKSNATIATNNIDLRMVLTPPPNEIDGYIAAHHRSKNNTGNNNNNEASREKISEILRHEKLALLAKEARRVLIDREIPFQEMAEFKNEAGVRRMSKQDPSVFLSLFSRAFCISERNKSAKRKRRTKGGETGTGAPSVATQAQDGFTHRRFHPPSLKTASHKKKKLKEKRDREARNKQAANNNKTRNDHRNAPAELQHKLRVMYKKIDRMANMR
jgi:hypothetical protein